MATLKDVRAAAKKIGATVEDDKTRNNHECRVEAPHGHRWNEGIHEFVASVPAPWKPDYDDLLARMEGGVVKCPPDCEWCYPEEEEDGRAVENS